MTDRDKLVRKHPRPQSQPGVPHPIEDDITGKYEGDERALWRSKRPTDQRIAHIEKGLDEVREEQKRQADAATDQLVMLGEVKGSLGKIEGALDFIKLAHSEKHKTERTRLTSRGKMIASIVGAVCLAVGTIVTAVLAGACS